jgi:hypothetical protein
VANVRILAELNVPEPRVLKERLAVGAGGSGRQGWDPRVGASFWGDPITSTVMLNPLPILPAWRTTFTGSYVRLAKAAYTLITAASWIEHDIKAAGDHYLQSLNVNEVVYTTASYTKNRAFYLNWYTGGVQGADTTVVIECGWGVRNAAGSVWLKFAANGQIAVVKSGSIVEVYDASNDLMSAGKARTAPQSLVGRFTSALLIPCRLRELLVVTDAGGGFSHPFEDLDAQSSTNVITPAAVFGWYVPVGQACVQCAPLKFETAATVYGPRQTLRYAPATGRVFSPLITSNGPDVGTQSVTASLVEGVSLAAFVPNGVKTDVRVKVALTGDGDTSPFLYAADMISPPTVQNTANEPFDVRPYVTHLSLSVPERGPTTVSLECHSPDAMEAAGLAKVRRMSDLPVRLAVTDGTTTVDLLRGLTGPPETPEGQGGQDGAARVSWQAQDRDALFPTYLFADTYAYDGLLMTDAYADLIATLGFTSADYDITADTFRLPFNINASMGEWQLLPQLGDTAQDWLEKLWRDYAATWITGWAPTLTGYKKRFRRPDTFTNTPSMNLYRSTADARAAGVPEELIAKRLLKSLKRLPAAPEANEVSIVGVDRRTGKRIRSQYDDAASQAPGTAVALRPDNWRSRLVRYLLDAEDIGSLTVADRARDAIKDRITPGRDVIEIGADFLVRTDLRPMWKGDVIRVFKEGSHTLWEGDFRILYIPDITFTFLGKKDVTAGIDLPYFAEGTYHCLKIAGAGGP